ncbi:MAG: NAD(P)/FAD-dependent oxidoreductase [Aeromicrobium erythreum]
MTTGVVVGSGPNGLAAAVVLARAGLDVTVLEAADTIGGGARSAELTVPGLVHDICSAIHPTGIASPFLRSLDLERHGLEWVLPAVQATHHVDPHRAGVMYDDLDRTAAAMGADADRWRRVFAPFVDHVDEVVEDVFGPLLHVPAHPVRFARFGARAALPVQLATARWRTDEARGLMSGLAAHVIAPMTRPSTTGIAMMFATIGQSYGWPAAKGGSQAIVDALVAELGSLGGRVETGHRVTELPPADVVLLDTVPSAALDIVGDRAPAHVRAAFRRWRHGPGSFKLDLAVEGGIPWLHEESRRAGTVHLGGTIAEVHAGERAVVAGRMPERPFVLLAQQYLADPGRSVGDVHPVWAYMHVPAGYAGDATQVILDEIERHAPGTRDRVVAMRASSPADLEAHNANYVGGDITGGANTVLQTVFRPRPGLDPYKVADGVWLCSSSAPPGGGVHGMAGYHAATRAVRSL